MDTKPVRDRVSERVHHPRAQLFIASDERAAEQCLRIALDIARQQKNARLFELRSTTSLAALVRTGPMPRSL